MKTSLYTTIGLNTGIIITVYRDESAGDVYGQTRTIYRVFDHVPGYDGSHLDSFDTLGDAKKYADLYVKFIDNGGDGTTPEAAAAFAFSLENSIFGHA